MFRVLCSSHKSVTSSPSCKGHTKRIWKTGSLIYFRLTACDLIPTLSGYEIIKQSVFVGRVKLRMLNYVLMFHDVSHKGLIRVPPQAEPWWGSWWGDLIKIYLTGLLIGHWYLRCRKWVCRQAECPEGFTGCWCWADVFDSFYWLHLGYLHWESWPLPQLCAWIDLCSIWHDVSFMALLKVFYLVRLFPYSEHFLASSLLRGHSMSAYCGFSALIRHFLQFSYTALPISTSHKRDGHVWV